MLSISNFWIKASILPYQQAAEISEDNVEEVEEIRLHLEYLTHSHVNIQEVEKWLNLDADESEPYLVEIEKEVERELQGDDIEEEENNLEQEVNDNLADKQEWCGLDSTLSMIWDLENGVSHPDCEEILGDIYSKTLDMLHRTKSILRLYKTENRIRNRRQLTLHDLFE